MSLNKLYKYGYRLRPPAIATEPSGYVDWEGFHNKDNGYWGYVFYNRKLTGKEIYDYDLDYLGEEE